MSGHISDSLGFHDRMTSLELKLKQSEDERIKLEEKFNQLLKSNKSEEAMQVYRLRESYCQVLERDRERCVRNDTILQTLTRIENRTTALTARTDRLRLLTHYYEAYMAQHFPRWKRLDSKYSSVFGSTSDINEMSRSMRSLPSPSPSLYSPSPSITRRSSLVVPDYEIMEAKYSYINNFLDGSKPVRRALFENTARSKSPTGYKENAGNINRNTSVLSVCTLSPNLATDKHFMDTEQNTSNDLLNLSLSQESLNTLRPFNENKTSQIESSVSKTQVPSMKKTINTTTPFAKSQILDSKPLRSTFRPQSRPLSKSSSFSVSSYARRPDSLNVPERPPSLQRRPSLMSRLRTPSPPRNRSPSPLSKMSSQSRSKSPLGVVDDIFKKYLINYDKRYLSDPVSESKYGKYLYPPKSSEYDYIRNRQDSRESDVCTHRFQEIPTKPKNTPYFSKKDTSFDAYSSCDSLSMKMPSDNTFECEFSSPRSNYSSQWRDWSHYRERYEHPRRCTSDVSRQPYYSDDYLNQNYPSNKYSRAVPSVIVDSSNLNYTNKSFSNQSYDTLRSPTSKPYLEDFPNMESRYEWNEASSEIPYLREDSFKKKETFKMPQTPKKVSFSNECLYDERLESEAGSSIDDYNIKENGGEYSKSLLDSEALLSNHNRSPLNEDFSLSETITGTESKEAQLTDFRKNITNSGLDGSKRIENDYPLQDYSIADGELKTELSFPASYTSNYKEHTTKESEPDQKVLDGDPYITSPNASKEGEDNLDDKMKSPVNIVSEADTEINSKINTYSDLPETSLSSQMNILLDKKPSPEENTDYKSSDNMFGDDFTASVEKITDKANIEQTSDIQLHSSQEKLDSKFENAPDLGNECKELLQPITDHLEEPDTNYQPDKFGNLNHEKLDIISKNDLPESHENQSYLEEKPNANQPLYDNNYNTEPFDTNQALVDQQPITEDNHRGSHESRVYSQENMAQDYPQQPDVLEHYTEGEFQQQPTDYPVENYGQEEISGYQQPVQEQYSVDGYNTEEQYQPNIDRQYEDSYPQSSEANPVQFKEGIQEPAESSTQQYEPDYPANYPSDPQYQYDDSGNILNQPDLPEQYDQQQLPEYNQYEQSFDPQQPQYEQQQLQYDQQQPQYDQQQPQYDQQQPQYDLQSQPYDQQLSQPYDSQSQHQSFDQQSHPYDQQQPQTYDPMSQHQSFDQQSHPYDQQQPQPYDSQSQHQSFDQQSHPYDQQPPTQYDPQSQHQSFDQQQPQPYDQQSQHQSFDQQSHPYDQQQTQPYDSQSQHQSFDQQSHPYDQQPQPYDQQPQPYDQQPQQYEQYSEQQQPVQYDQYNQPQQYGSQQQLDQYDQQQQPYDQYNQQPQNYDQYDPNQQPVEYNQYDEQQPQQYDQQPDEYGNYGDSGQVYEGGDNSMYPTQGQAYQGAQPTYDENAAYATQQQPTGYPSGDTQPPNNQGENVVDGFEAQAGMNNQMMSGGAVIAPDLSRVLESDSESGPAPAPARSHDDSSDFDFSSGNK